MTLRTAALRLFLPAAILATGCSDDPSGANGPRIVSDVSGQYCIPTAAPCEAIVGIPFHVENADTAETYRLEIRLDLDADGTVDEEPAPGDVLSGTFPAYVVTDTLPAGNHELLIDLVDGTGATYPGTIPLVVADCAAPVPICINGLALQLQPVSPPADVDGDGDLDAAAMTVYATDFLASLTTDCSLPLRYSVNRKGETPDIDGTALVLTCDDVGTVQIEIHAWDSAVNPEAVQPDGSRGGPNHDFCETYILVQGGLDGCN